MTASSPNSFPIEGRATFMEDPIRGMMKDPSVVAIKAGLRLAATSVDRVVSIQERLPDIGRFFLHVLSECWSRRASCLSQADQGQRGLSGINAKDLSHRFLIEQREPETVEPKGGGGKMHILDGCRAGGLISHASLFHKHIHTRLLGISDHKDDG